MNFYSKLVWQLVPSVGQTHPTPLLKDLCSSSFRPVWFNFDFWQEFGSIFMVLFLPFAAQSLATWDPTFRRWIITIKFCFYPLLLNERIKWNAGRQKRERSTFSRFLIRCHGKQQLTTLVQIEVLYVVDGSINNLPCETVSGGVSSVFPLKSIFLYLLNSC